MLEKSSESQKKVSANKIIGAGGKGLLSFAVPDTNIIATALLVGCFAAAFLLLTVGSVIKFRQKQTLILVAQGEELPVIPQPPPLRGAGRVRTWWCSPVDIAGLLLMSMIFFLFAISQSMASEVEKPEMMMTPSLLISNIVIFAILVGIVTAIVWRRVKPVAWLGLRWRQWPLFFLIGPLAVLVMWMVLGVLMSSGYIPWLEKLVGSESTQDAVKLLRDSQDFTTVALMAFSAAIVAPLAEEVIFRGYLYPVAKHFAGPWVAGLFTSLIFAAGHGNVPLMLPLFLLGILMTWAYEKTGSLWAAISIHFFFNSATVCIQLAMRSGLFPTPANLP